MMDGSRWVFEFKQGETYCVVHEQSPTVGPLYEFGRLLIEIAEIEIPEAAFY